MQFKENLLLGVILIVIIFISGCTIPSNLTGQSQNATQPVCNKPYILVGTSCCLDTNNNDICDSDEKKCPDSCNDNNLCTKDYCGSETNYICKNDIITPCCGNNLCENGESTSSCSVDCKDATTNVEDLKKTVVYIQLDGETCCNDIGQKIPYNLVGSGVIIPSTDVPNNSLSADEKVVVTNRHVVDCLYTGICTFGANQVITIETTDGFRYNPTNVYYAKDDVDIAFLIFKKNPGDKSKDAIVDRDHVPKSGDEVYAIGNPSGGSLWTVTRGIVSNIGKEPTSKIPVVQTDTAINPGNSGGGLFDKEKGKLLGINTWKYVGTEGIGYAIDSRELKDMAATANYCEAENTVPIQNQCIKCKTGEVLSEDFECVKSCYYDDTQGSFFYCSKGTYCSQGGCYESPNKPSNPNCPAGYVYGTDKQCHPECGSGTYCVGENNWCYNGECLTCNPGYYLGVDGYCYSESEYYTSTCPSDYYLATDGLCYPN